MGLCGSKADAFKFIQDMKQGNDEAFMAVLSDIHPGKKDKSGRVPWIEACKLNKLLVVKCFWAEQADKIDQRMKDEGLVAACGGATNHRVVRFLIDDVGASVTFKGEGLCTPLHACCRKSKGGLAPDTTPQILAHRRVAAQMLITKGAEFEAQDVDKKTPLLTCCFYKNEKMAMIIAERGGRIAALQEWMNKADVNAKNWVAGAIMSKYAWKSDSEFKDELKKKFFEEFDKDGNGELDEKEFTHFIAFNMKLAFKRGFIPTKAFVEDGSLEVDQIEKLLEERAADLLANHKRRTDRNGDGSYGWDELFPLVQDFYANIWNSERPKDAGNDEEYHGEDADLRMEQEAARPPQSGKGEAEEALPADWKEVVDPRTLDKDGKPRSYYFNAKTKATTWKRSDCFKDAGAAAAAPEPEKPLPKPWSAVEDKKSGRTYFYNAKTKATTWKRSDCFKSG